MTMTLRQTGLALAILAAAPAVSGCGYNTIPTKQERAQAAWADVQNQYQRRADLIPNLVATVQGAAISERTILTEVTEARARATSIQVSPETLNDPAAFQAFQAAQSQVTSALSRLLATVEAYPDVKSNQGFLQLQAQIEGSENRISISRRDYNEAVRDYNTSLRTFPTVIWAKTLQGDAEPMQLFAASAASQDAPTVQFNLGPAAPTAGTAPGGDAPAVTPGTTPSASN